MDDAKDQRTVNIEIVNEEHETYIRQGRALLFLEGVALIPELDMIVGSARSN